MFVGKGIIGLEQIDSNLLSNFSAVFISIFNASEYDLAEIVAVS